MKMQYKVCRECGSNLDSGERCDCTEKEAAPQQRKQPQLKQPTASVARAAHDVKSELNERVTRNG